MFFVQTWYGELDSFTLYPTEEAARATLNPHGNYSVRQATWRDRETCRLSNGTYTKLPNLDLVPIRDHFAHISSTDPGKIAFTENPEKGEQDRQTVMKPGRYFARYYPHLTPQQVEAYASWAITGQEPPPEPFGQLIISTDFVAVYARGPHSCMYGADAVSVYDAGDLAIAHVGEHSRAIVWPERKTYGRVYAKSNDREEKDLVHQLRQLGYKPLDETENGFNGARLLKIEENDNFVMPYLDRQYGVKDGDNYWIMTNGPDREYKCQRTDGYLTEQVPHITCEDCGSRVPQDHSRRGICNDCLDANYYWCDDLEEYVHSSVPTTEVRHGYFVPTEHVIDYYVDTPTGLYPARRCQVIAPNIWVCSYDSFVCPIIGRNYYYHNAIYKDGTFYSYEGWKRVCALREAADALAQDQVA